MAYLLVEAYMNQRGGDMKGICIIYANPILRLEKTWMRLLMIMPVKCFTILHVPTN